MRMAIGSARRRNGVLTLSATEDAGAAANAMAALSAAIPKPAESAPPAVDDSGAKGAMSRYAREDHTHVSSVTAERKTFALTAGKATWTYPKAFPQGVVPVLNVTAETPDGATYVLDARVVAGSVTNTQCVIMVNRINQSVTLPTLLTSLLGSVINLLTAGTGSAVVHCWARKP